MAVVIRSPATILAHGIPCLSRPSTPTAIWQPDPLSVQGQAAPSTIPLLLRGWPKFTLVLYRGGPWLDRLPVRRFGTDGNGTDGTLPRSEYLSSLW